MFKKGIACFLILMMMPCSVFAENLPTDTTQPLQIDNLTEIADKITNGETTDIFSSGNTETGSEETTTETDIEKTNEEDTGGLSVFSEYETKENEDGTETSDSVNSFLQSSGLGFDTNIFESSKDYFDSMSMGELGKLSMDEDFLKNFSFGDMTFSESFSKMTGVDISQNSLFDTSAFGNGFDIGAVNLQYSALQDNLNQEKSNTDLSGKSQSATAVFQNNYGDLANNLTVDKAKIPSSFNPESMLSKQSKSINKTYKNTIKNDSAFKTTKKNINVSSVVKQAKKGVSTPSLPSATSLKNSVKGDSSKIGKSIKSEFNKNSKNVSSLVSASKTIVDIQKSINNTKYNSAKKQLSYEQKSLKEKGKKDYEKNSDSIIKDLNEAADNFGSSDDVDPNSAKSALDAAFKNPKVKKFTKKVKDKGKDILNKIKKPFKK